MKAFIISLAFLSIANFSQAYAQDQADTSSNSVWIDTNTVLISNSQSPEIARRDCETTMRILNIMSNDKIIFRPTCEPTYNPRCNYYYCYQLYTRALVVDQRRLEK